MCMWFTLSDQWFKCAITWLFNRDFWHVSHLPASSCYWFFLHRPHRSVMHHCLLSVFQERQSEKQTWVPSLSPSPWTPCSVSSSVCVSPVLSSPCSTSPSSCRLSTAPSFTQDTKPLSALRTFPHPPQFQNPHSFEKVLLIWRWSPSSVIVSSLIQLPNATFWEAVRVGDDIIICGAVSPVSNSICHPTPAAGWSALCKCSEGLWHCD